MFKKEKDKFKALSKEELEKEKTSEFQYLHIKNQIGKIVNNNKPDFALLCICDYLVDILEENAIEWVKRSYCNKMGLDFEKYNGGRK